MDRYITPILFPVVYVEAYEEEEEYSEHPIEIEMESREIYVESPSDDPSWTEQTAIFPGFYPPPIYSSDDDDRMAADHDNR